MSAGNINETPRGSRLHIAIFGRRNAGKSSLINALTNQDMAIVSDVPGTTTDPVYKAMELLPVGPVVLIDTAGIDDVGELGRLRIEKTKGVLKKTDLMVLVIDPGLEPEPKLEAGLKPEPGKASLEQVLANEVSLIEQARELGVPIVGVLNKVDLNPTLSTEELQEKLGISVVAVSTYTGQGIKLLKEELIKSAPQEWAAPTIIGDLINPGDLVVLVVPIDLAAPKGRLILPQVQTIRDILDNDACAIVVKERELKKALSDLNRKPKLVVTDSQVFLKADADTPRDILLTSFSILFARYKGNLETLVSGALAVENLNPGDRVLIAEACTHHRMADDIGQVKIPRWLRQKVGGELQFDWSSGLELPENLGQYKLIVHCGACMINRKEMLHRIRQATAVGVPIVNYGVLIGYLQGVLKRVLSPFPTALKLLEHSAKG